MVYTPQVNRIHCHCSVNPCSKPTSADTPTFSSLVEAARWCGARPLLPVESFELRLAPGDPLGQGDGVEQAHFRAAAEIENFPWPGIIRRSEHTVDNIGAKCKIAGLLAVIVERNLFAAQQARA